MSNNNNHDPVIWALAFFAVVFAVASIAAMSKYENKNPGTPVSVPAANREIGDPRKTTGCNHDQQTVHQGQAANDQRSEAGVILRHNDCPAVPGPADRVYEDGTESGSQKSGDRSQNRADSRLTTKDTKVTKKAENNGN